MTMHSFDIDIAKKYGVHSAVLLNYLYFWVKKNEANNQNFYDGKYWTYNSKKAFETLFPYMTARQIDYALNKLIEQGIIETGNYNTSAYDRTLWYAITKKGYSILQNCEMESTKNANGNNENVQPIPYINTNINTDKKPNNNNLDTLITSFDFSETTEEELKEALKDFEEMRKKIKKPLTDRAKKGIIKKLYDLSGGNASIAIEVLDNSIMNSWQGIFGLKQEPKKQQQAAANTENEYPF